MVRGFLASGIAAGIKKDGKKDFALIVSDAPAQAAGVFTTNAVKAAPVLIDIERIKNGKKRGVVVNSGNANACTGERGAKDALSILSAAEKELGLKSGELLISSTGVIGEFLPVRKMLASIPALVGGLGEDGWQQAAQAIMTTDAYPKTACGRVKIGDVTVDIAGMAKGAGMICPSMATMLSFFATDAGLSAGLLKNAIKGAAKASFNRITVDNDASTNDTVLIFANGLAGKTLEGKRDLTRFTGLLTELSTELAHMIVKDGEGATRFITIEIKGAGSRADAERAARKIAASALVKTAFFGGDPNWGRIMAAVGSSGARVNPERIDISFNGIKAVKNGVSTGKEIPAKERMKKRDIKVEIDLKGGRGVCTLWTCDLGHEYVRINSAYRT
jgi:glutamate N-acetyltransferase/amino-acid N-acetyltransferase